MKQLLRYIGICIIGGLLTVGCNQNIGPDKMAQSLYQFYIQEDMTEIESLNLTNKSAKAIIDSSVQSFEEELEQSLKRISGKHNVVINKAHINKAIIARRELEKQLSVQVEVILAEKNSAKVKVDTTYFNESSIYDKASTALEKKMKDIKVEDEEIYVQQCIDTYLDEIIKAYQEAEVSTDYKSIQTEFVKQKDSWRPADQQMFINQLANLTSGYDVELRGE